MGATLDAGALIAFERGDRDVVSRIRRAVERGERIFIPAGVIGQVWRDGGRPARVARLLDAAIVDVVPLDHHVAQAAGRLCGLTGSADVIDATVALCARQRGGPVLTSDPDDLRRLDPELSLIKV